MSWSHKPALHFLAIGSLLFAVDRGLASGAHAPRSAGAGVTRSVETLVVSEGRVAELHAQWSKRTGGAPTREQLGALVEFETDDEILYREARRLGFQRSDSLVRRRLAQNIAFATPGDSRSEIERAREALALGMDRTDLVVRRRLIQKMKLRAYESARAPQPDDTELRAYFEDHAHRFAAQARVDIAHVYWSRDRYGDRTGEVGRLVLERFARDGIDPEQAGEWGDAFLYGRELSAQSESDLSDKFGEPFARAVFSLEPGGWRGPIRSTFGEHGVWVRSHSPAPTGSFEALRGQLTEALLEQRGAAALREQIAELRLRYRIATPGLDSGEPDRIAHRAIE